MTDGNDSFQAPARDSKLQFQRGRNRVTFFPDRPDGNRVPTRKSWNRRPKGSGLKDRGAELLKTSLVHATLSLVGEAPTCPVPAVQGCERL